MLLEKLIAFLIVMVVPILTSLAQSPSFSRPPVILMLGAPFSGKGTQADLLSEKLSVPTLQSGDLFRKEVSSGSELGRKMAQFMDAGLLIPDELTIDLITKTLSSPDYENGVIMDGYPRNIEHLVIFENILKFIDMELNFVVFLEADYELLLSRVDNRLVCKNCGRSVSVSTAFEACCDNSVLIKRNDDTTEKFIKRYQVFEENTIPLVKELQSKYPERIIHLTPELLSTKDKFEINDWIINEIRNAPFRRIIPSIDPLNFDKPFNWILKFVKENRTISREDLRFYLNWALECNKPDQSGMLRRIVFISTTSKPKFLEYRKMFLLYGIEVIRFPVLNDDSVVLSLLSDFDGPEFSAIALLSDSNNLYKPIRTDVTVEDLESNRIPLCSMKDGAHCANICVLSVIYAAKSEDSKFNLKSYKLVDRVDGIIKTENNNVSPFTRVFGWDNIFHVKGLGKSYHELREFGFKNSARERVISSFLRRHVHYKTARNLKFNAVPVKKSVDFGINLTEFFTNIKEYNLDLVKEYGFTNIWKKMLQSGTFLRAAAFRRIGIYWNPGVNGGLPLVKKGDYIHEITYMAHDIGHQILPDLVFTGHNSFIHKRVYIMWRMMSEAFTMALTDMIFIDALKNSGVEYDFDKRKIYPLFRDLNLNASPKNNPGYLNIIRKIVHANFVYCLKGDDSEYRQLIQESGGPGSFDNLEAFKNKYAPFFVEDFRWTEQNYNSMVSSRSHEAKKWWEAVQELNNLLGDHRIKSIDDFISESSKELDLEQIFSRAFDENILPVISAPAEQFDLTAEPEEVRKFRAFTRWMIGQLSICFKFDFIPESAELFTQISTALKNLNGRINDKEIDHLRSVYESYLDRLLELSLISSDDHATFSQVYPLFDPFFVCYDKSVTEYEPLASISSRILNDRNHHYATYHRQAERILGRAVLESEKTFLNMFYLMIERSGGMIHNGLFVVEPGVMILTETVPVSPDSAISFLLSGISVETSLEFIAHHETKVARLTSSKTKAMNLPLFEINNYDQSQMKLIESALKSRMSVATEGSTIENVNLTLPAAKSTVAVFTVTLKDLDSILIGRLSNPRGNETAVIKVATRICQALHSKYPEHIKPLEYYLTAKNQFKYSAAPQEPAQIQPVQTKILSDAWDLFKALNIPAPPESAPFTSAFISMADFNARVTYMSFSKTPVTFTKSIAFVKNIVVGEGHASILSSFQVIHEGKTKRTKELFTEFGWNSGLEPLLH